MKNEKIKEFLTKLAQEESFKVDFLKLKEKVEKKGFSKTDNEKFISECLLPWSKKLGYKLSKKDFIDFDRTQKPTEITGLSPAELENVSGGGFMLWSLFAMFGSALAGLAGGGGSTGNNANTNSDSFSSSLVEYSPTGIASQDYYDYHYGTTPADFGSGAVDGTGTTTPTAPKSPTGIASMDYGIEYDNYEANYGEPPADFGSGEIAGAGTTTLTAPKGSTGIASMDYYVANYGETPVDFSDGSFTSDAGTTISASSQQAQPTPAGDTFSPINPSTWQEVPEQSGGSAEKPMSTALVTTPGQPQASVGDSGQNYARSSPRPSIFPQPRLAGNVGQYGKNIGDSSSTSNGGQETINMLTDIHSAENANFKLFETQTNQNDSHIGTALVSTSEQASGSLANPVSAEELSANSTFTGPVSGVTEGGVRWHLNTKGETVFDRDISFSQQATTTGGSTTGSITSTLPTSAASLAGSAPIGLLGYEQSSGRFGAAAGGIVEDPMLLSNNRVVLLKGLDTLDKELNTVGREHQSKLRDKLNSIKDNVNGASNIDVLEEIELEMDKLKAAIQAAGGTPVDPRSGTAAGGDGGQSVLSQSPQTPNSTPANAPSYQPGQVSIYTGFDAGGHPYSSAQKINPKGTASTNSSQSGQPWKDFAKEAAKAAAGGIGIGVGAAALGSAYTAGSKNSYQPEGKAQQNASKTKEATAKAEDKKSTKEAKKEESDFIRLFKENLQKDSPETFKYIQTLK